MSQPTYAPISPSFHGMLSHMGFGVYDVQQRLIRGGRYLPSKWVVEFHGALLDGTPIVVRGRDEIIVMQKILEAVYAHRGVVVEQPAEVQP